MKTKTINLYEYDELSDIAKSQVKTWYLNDPLRGQTLTEIFKENWLKYFFPDCDLAAQYSLNFCQGDGVNIYGQFKLSAIVKYIENWKESEHIYTYAHNPIFTFTTKELKTLADYISLDNMHIDIPYNRRYSYCMVNRLDFVDDWIESLQLDVVSIIDDDLLYSFQSEAINIIRSICSEMEEAGYKYLYEADEEEISEICQANMWYFTEHGMFEIA